MNADELKKILENQFVEDYDKLLGFMDNINEVFIEIGINSSYNYNEFCLDIEKHVILLYKTQNISIITPKILSDILNNLIRDKITTDPEYKEKLNIFFKSEDYKNI